MSTLCFDIGGSKYRAALISDNGVILCESRQMWGALSADSILQALVTSGRTLLQAHPAVQADAIGVTIPGLAKAEEGLWVEASFSGIRDFPIGRLLSVAFQLPVYAENDARACALGEKLFGAAQDADTFLYVTVSNGVGGAVFADGKLLYGAGAAGEIGHVTVAEQGRGCNCGKRGCLEMYAAGPGLAQTYLEMTGRKMDGQQIAQAARQGEEAAREVFRLEGAYLGQAIGMAVNILSPERVIIGGGLSLAFDLFEQPLMQTVKEQMYLRANQNLKIVSSPLQEQGGLLGAAALTVCGIKTLYGYRGKAV